MHIINQASRSSRLSMSKIILYIATSKDGFIADRNGGVGWLPQPRNDHDLEVVGYKNLMERIDTIIMGSKSFKQIIEFGEWSWTDKHTYVFSSQALVAPLSCITIMNDSPRRFMERMSNRDTYKDIWLVGGSELAKSFARDGLIDEIVLTIVPQTLGDGIPLGLSLDDFDFKSKYPLMDGMLQRIYSRKRL